MISPFSQYLIHTDFYKLTCGEEVDEIYIYNMVSENRTFIVHIYWLVVVGDDDLIQRMMCCIPFPVKNQSFSD